MQTTVLTSAMDQVVGNLAAMEAWVVKTVKSNLLQRTQGSWSQADDDLFAPHTTYCVECWRTDIIQRPGILWETALAPEAEAADKVLMGRTPPDRIHKGAPLVNSGFSCLVAGNLDRAMAVIAQAGEEEILRGNAGGSTLVIGDHVLTEKALIDPIDRQLTSTVWPADFQAITNINLDKAELKRMLNWLSTKGGGVAVALQALVGLRRFFDLRSYCTNDATKHLRVQNLADLVLVIESSMRAWQKGCEGLQLEGRMKKRISGLTNVSLAFQTTLGRFTSQFPKDPATNQAHPDKETATGVNWAITDGLKAIDAAPDATSKAGAACYLAVRLRNSLMHVIDGSVDLYTDPVKLSRVTGIMLAAIRLSQRGEDGSLSTF